MLFGSQELLTNIPGFAIDLRHPDVVTLHVIGPLPRALRHRTESHDQDGEESTELADVEEYSNGFGFQEFQIDELRNESPPMDPESGVSFVKTQPKRLLANDDQPAHQPDRSMCSLRSSSLMRRIEELATFFA
jgi:hypothetical protein